MICKTKTIILALALNARAVEINMIVKPDKLVKEGKDVLKAGEKEGKEVDIVKDDGLDLWEDINTFGTADDLNADKIDRVEATVRKYWEKPNNDFSWKNSEGDGLEESFKDDGLSGLNSELDASNAIENTASSDAGDLLSNEAYWNAGDARGVFSSDEWAAFNEKYVFDGAENAELSFDDYFTAVSSEADIGNGVFKFSKYLDRVQQDEFLDVLEEEGPEEAVDYLEMNVGSPWEKFGMSMDEFEEQLNKVVEKVWKEYSSIYEGAEADEGILEALGEGADDGADLLSRIDIRNPHASGELPEEYNIIGENHVSDFELNEFDAWQPIDNSDIEAIGEKYSDPNWWTKDLIDVEDLPLDIGVNDSAASAIDGASEALSGLGDGFLDFSAGNLEMLGIETAEMSTEELIAAGLAADLGLVVAA